METWHRGHNAACSSHMLGWRGHADGDFMLLLSGSRPRRVDLLVSLTVSLWIKQHSWGCKKTTPTSLVHVPKQFLSGVEIASSSKLVERSFLGCLGRGVKMFYSYTHLTNDATVYSALFMAYPDSFFFLLCILLGSENTQSCVAEFNIWRHVYFYLFIFSSCIDGVSFSWKYLSAYLWHI